MPVRCQAERRALAKARRATFDRPRAGATASGRPTSRSSRRPAAAPGGSRRRRLRERHADGAGRALRAQAAIAEAERLLGRPLAEDCLNEETGELHPLVIVSNNGPAYKSDRFALFIASRPELRHVHEARRAGENGVVGTFFESVKYEYL
jgi:hypothetical protein